MAWAQAVGTFLRSGTVISLCGGLLTTSGYVIYKDYSRYQRMIEIYSSGNILAPFAENRFEIAYLHRPELENTLSDVLSCNFSNEFYLVSGEVGCGKTRTIVEMVRRLMETNGSAGLGAPIYVQVTQGTSFPETLASAVHFYFDEHISHKFLMDFVMRVSSFPRQDTESRLTRVLNAIENSSFMYMQETGRPVVLIVDGIKTLQTTMPGALDKLIEKAKLWADANTVKLIFVNNDEETEDLMQSNFSCWSRAAEPITFGDLSRKEALEFLTNGIFMENVDASKVSTSRMCSELASDIVDIVGGRIIHLIAFKRDYFAGSSFVDTLRHLKNHECEKFINVSRKPSQWKVVSKLRNAPSKTLPLSKVIEVTSEDDVHALLRMKVIRFERSSSGALVKFFSPLTEYVVDELEKKYSNSVHREEFHKYNDHQYNAHHKTNIVKSFSFPFDISLGVIGSAVILTLLYVLSPGK